MARSIGSASLGSSSKRFGTLLDRQAGSFRFGPFGINVPTTRIYEPGTNILNTTWHTPTGSATAREALTLGPTTHEDEITPHTRAPADEDGYPPAGSAASFVEGSVEMEMRCEPDFDYGREPASWSLGDDHHTADATSADVSLRLRSSMPLGIGDETVRAPHAARGEQAFWSLFWARGAGIVRGHR